MALTVRIEGNEDKEPGKGETASEKDETEEVTTENVETKEEVVTEKVETNEEAPSPVTDAVVKVVKKER